MQVIRAGRLAYAAAWDRQRELVEARIAGLIPDTALVCEHDPVYTLGRRRDARRNLLDPGDTPVFEVERGGDVTWHGPGQVVAYPIRLLEPLDLNAHLRQLEALMIGVCASLGVVAVRDERNAGVWLNGRKIGSVGVACRRQVTWHGLALNVEPDLSGFRRIAPCGLDAVLLSSLAAEGVACERDGVELRVIEALTAW